ncbi:MAG TPA: HEAT repeat domain-containing protein [Candidatus Polarisedimenticolia bacterium]|nr:HEAT repeat domain-containing protein [Candidatus Polarisedimenticolia bacterium]
MRSRHTRQALRAFLTTGVLSAGLFLTACAPAHDAESLFAQMHSDDAEARQDASETLDTILKNGDYRVFVRGVSSPNQMYRVQSILFLARMSQPEARAALRDLLKVEARSLLPYNPIRLKPSSEMTDSRILVAHLIAEGGGDPEAVGVLLRGVGEDQPAEVLSGTCFALGALRDPKGIPFLVTAAHHPDSEVVRAAVQAAGRFHEPEALAVFRVAASNPTPEVRIDAVTSLTFQEGPGALEFLRTLAASDPSPAVRALAIRQMERFKDTSVVPFLISQLGSADQQLRGAAYDVLQRLTGQSMPPRLEAWSRWWARNGARAAIH